MATFDIKHTIGNESPDPLMPLYPPQIVQEEEMHIEERLPVDDEQPEEVPQEEAKGE